MRLPLKVVEFDQTQRKIVLSVDDYYRGKDHTDLDSFIQKHPTTSGAQMAAAMEQVIGDSEGVAGTPDSGNGNPAEEANG